MVKIYAGFTTDGEWNSLRSKGYTRPLSIFEVRSSARNKCSHFSMKTMTGMLTPKSIVQLHGGYQMHYVFHLGDASGAIVAEIVNPAISSQLLHEIYYWKEEGCTMEDIMIRLRKRVVPSGSDMYQWNEGP